MPAPDFLRGQSAVSDGKSEEKRNIENRYISQNQQYFIEFFSCEHAVILALFW